MTKTKVKDGAKYCHLHNPSTSPTKSKPSPGKPINPVGYIYVYTYEELYNSRISSKTQPTWLGVQTLENHSQTTQVPDAQILVKLGVTTQTKVETRLHQWERQCGKPIVNLTPTKVQELLDCYTTTTSNSTTKQSKQKSNSLTQMLRRLTLNPSTRNPGKPNRISTGKNLPAELQKRPASLKKLRNFSTTGGGFFTDGTGPAGPVQEVERKLHNELWSLYGRGVVRGCGCGCEHTEWFFVPVAELPRVLVLADSVTGRA
ncbi:hypothetical protein TBLA_0B09180 [Henningerozyma blattae CBS 6284]|uniref:DUF1766-domain-containing protein n=1 Tax=Henningerozyma blattae (strain ATCC 34711 / CBS 6284 / DSM 70876 / NBRC 10599 / NRRL Y-10934 / UCD 77-7) TaxID=1071380 RepID=I2H031_HENB6|nr:hypothetical protein TBLA_0B09180 [Tetrapisispora blattae CBS 6284]CCH59733.1 hypothetical protein TBLA_0B09180 [Tetrapisispora blattae CBS 6284]